MELWNFIRDHPLDWEEKLAAAPYFLEIKHNFNFVLFKYNQFQSDMTNPISQEARGCIFYIKDAISFCVCYPFRKFANWNESYSDTPHLDWRLGIDVQEKIDGSIMKLWCYKGVWYLSTNTVIDAFDKEAGQLGFIFVDFIQKYDTYKNFCNNLNPNYTYIFELVAPWYNRIVVHYPETALYFIGCRNMETLEELNPDEISMPLYIKRPRHFKYNNFNEVLAACHNMGDNEEGYVCVGQKLAHGSFARIKVKGAEYLRLHKLANFTSINNCKIISFWQNDSLDDFVSINPKFKPQIENVLLYINHLIKQSEIAYNCVKDYEENAKEYALHVKTYPHAIQAYLFARKKNNQLNPIEFFKQVKPQLLEDKKCQSMM